VWVAHHVLDAQVFKRDPVITLEQVMHQLFQKVLTLIGNVKVRLLELEDCLAAVLAALLSA